MKLTGKQKVAIVLLNIDRKVATDILKTFSHTELLELGLTMSEMEKLCLDNETIEKIMEEFMTLSKDSSVLSQSTNQLFLMLKDAVGEAKAREIMEQLKNEGSLQPFDTLRGMKASTLSAILQSEHSQTIALILAHMESEKSAEILQSFPDEKQVDIVSRLLTLEEAPVDVMEQISDMVLARASILAQDRFSIKKDLEDRVKNIAEVMNFIGDRGSKKILQQLSETAPEMAEEIEDHMFVFNDLKHLNARDIRNVLTQVDTKTIALALKGVPVEVSDHLTNALSKRIREIVSDEKEMLGMVPVDEVYEAQKEITKIAKNLSEEGKIHIRKSKGAVQMVE